MKRSETHQTFQALDPSSLKWEPIPVDTTKYRQAVGYIRLSDRAAREGETSLERQESEVRAWCQANGLELVAVCSDVGKSGRKLNRAGLHQAIGECSLRNAVLVAYSLDRIARDRKVLDRLKSERVAFRALDVPEVSEMWVDMMLFFNGLYSRMVSEKMAKYHAHRKEMVARGEAAPHPVPTARPNRETARKSIESAREVHVSKARTRKAHAWERIRPMYESGMSTRAIAASLTGSGFVSSRGKPWNHMAVARIIQEFGPVAVQ
jgi:DNA invertase Pin-like site-specific DNA recombinase